MQLKAYIHPLLLSEYEYIFATWCNLNKIPAFTKIVGLNLTDPGQSVLCPPLSDMDSCFSLTEEKNAQTIIGSSCLLPLEPLKQLQITYMTLPVNQATNG